MNLKSLSRAFTSNLGAIVVSPSEQTALAAEGIAEPTIQRYVLWRRATVLMVVVATGLSALVSTYSSFTDEDQPDFMETVTDMLLDKVESLSPEAKKMMEAFHVSAAPAYEKAEKAIDAAKEAVQDAQADKTDKAEKPEADKDAKTDAAKDDSDKEEKAGGKDEEEEQIKTMGRLAEDFRLLALYALPIAALIVLFLRNRFRLSFKIMVIAFGFSFFAPMLLALCPWSWWGVAEPKLGPGTNPLLFVKDQLEGLMEALALLGGLLPSVLSLIPGVQRACLRVKTLLPQALLPGWFIVVAAPLYGLFLLVVVVAVDQFTSEPAIIIPLALLSAASLTFAVRANVFTRPLLCDADFRSVRNVQRVIGLMSAAAGIILVAFLATREIFGVRLVGTVAKSSLVRPIEIVEFVLEVIGRSMFVSALGAEFIMRLSLTAWRQNRDIAASDAAANLRRQRWPRAAKCSRPRRRSRGARRPAGLPPLTGGLHSGGSGTRVDPSSNLQPSREPMLRAATSSQDGFEPTRHDLIAGWLSGTLLAPTRSRCERSLPSIRSCSTTASGDV